MLIITRRSGESFEIIVPPRETQETIYVTVNKSPDGGSKYVIEASDDILIFRSELSDEEREAIISRRAK